MQVPSATRLPDSLSSSKLKALTGDRVCVNLGVACISSMLDTVVAEIVEADEAAQSDVEHVECAPASVTQATIKGEKKETAGQPKSGPKPKPKFKPSSLASKSKLKKWTDLAAIVSKTSALWTGDLKSNIVANKQLCHNTKNFPRNLASEKRFKKRLCDIFASADSPLAQKEAIVKVIVELQIPLLFAELAYVSKVCTPFSVKKT